ncbi:MAG: phosphoribosylamine--glycine ligase [Dehalococcoidia bacterium]|nr:phosphoribosylamine--glycine ligase [Dehalococcoidia bacterium]
MKVVVAGSGAREHAITWKVSQSELVSELISAPGNPGMAAQSRVEAYDPLGIQAFAAWAHKEMADLVIVGSDDPIAAGLVDACEAVGVRAFGPSAAAARIEASKVFAKDLLSQHGIPTGPYKVFDQASAAHRYLDAPGRDYPVVVKADGLARGKGAIVSADSTEAHAAVAAMLEERAFGGAGDRILIEECLVGPEASVFAICDGEQARPFGAARDYKRIFDGDRGPNTGGMGAYSPTNLVPPAVLEDVRQRILQPTIEGLAAAGHPYRGVLYAGLMFTADGPQVIEFNARLGDPEAQVLLPLLKSDFVEIALAALEGRLAAVPIEWHDGAACGVALASAGYPDAVRDGELVSGLDSLGDDALLFHAGTALEADGAIRTAGGRVFTVVGLGPTLATARDVAYRNVERVRFEGRYYRGDIAAREITAAAAT